MMKKISEVLDISAEEIVKTGLASEIDWNILKDYTLKLFARGKEIAAKNKTTTNFIYIAYAITTIVCFFKCIY